MKTAVWYKINIQGHQPLSPPTHYHCTPMVLCYIYNQGQNLSLIRLHSVLQSTEKHILLLRINENNVHQWQMLSVVVVTEQCLSPGRKITQIFPSRGTQEALSVMSSSPVQVRCEQHIQIAWMIRYFGYSFGEPEVNVNLSCEWRERKTVLQGRQAKSESQDHNVKSDFIYILVTSSVHLARGTISLCVTAGFELILLWGMNIKYHLSIVVQSWWDDL